MPTLRVASASPIKLGGCREALMLGWPQLGCQVIAKPVELQSQPGLTVFAQPFEYETLQYARLRLLEMQRRYSTPRGDMVDVAIESGAFRHGERYVDQVVVIAFTQRRGEQLAIWSQPVYIPEGVAEEMLERRSHEPQLTAGGIINARHPLIPADNWQEFFPPGLSRHRQISEAVERALRPILG